jgi:hypothetical protein
MQATLMPIYQFLQMFHTHMIQFIKKIITFALFKASFIYHFTGVIECVAILDRLKIFSSYAKRIFTISPKKITLTFLCICLIFGIFPGFQYSPYEFVYAYFTSDGQVEKYIMYFLLLSAISSTNFGKIIQIVIFIIRDPITLFASVSLNISCYIKMKKHLAKRQILTTINQATLNRAVTSTTQVTESKKEKDRTYQHNMSQMTITLVLITTLARIITLSCGIYWLNTFDLIGAILGVSADLAIVLNSTMPFFVYLRFNTKYRKIFSDSIFRRSGQRKAQTESS